MNDTIILRKGTIEPSHYYTKDEILQVLPISEDLLSHWLDTGLAYLPTGPDGYLVDGSKLIEYIKENTVTRVPVETIDG